MLLLLVAVAVAAADVAPTSSTANLTLHNLCSFPVWPLITPNTGLPVPSVPDGEPLGRLDGGGAGLATLAFPAGAWSGRVTARTGCTITTGGGAGNEEEERCATGDGPPLTVAQVSVGGPGGLAQYSVSLVDGFNVAVVITPHGFAAGRRCPSLGCAVDLGSAACPGHARACGAGAAEARVFKRMCPDTRTNATDVEVTPQDCVAPQEIKVVFCPKQDAITTITLLS
ncbi:hypothetical protein PR202_ga22787 [Eleusine coracana subsp. coracana]|uniref:Thaumatin-like protein n=1 Tax=Eleusine coracana subsp. coracana TaxID=191504 RepID=A0AAV5D4I1_ELECO|nr:hypothetical protein PR202_ga22787 [Eleusine coracana subsp. coracana]